MNTAYDKYYKDREYFGNPYKGLVQFFKEYEPKGTVLDLGCGQGRDAVSLGKLGYKVIGVDYSSVGIQQLNEVASKLGIVVTGVSDDIYNYPITWEHDIILMDSMLHFYKNDIERETGLVNKVIREMGDGTVFCNCMIMGKTRERLLKSLISKSEWEFQVLLDEYMDYPDFNAKYHVYIIKKAGEKGKFKEDSE